MRTPALCLAAIKRAGTALEYAPEAFKTKELCLEAVKGFEGKWAIHYVPEHIRTAEFIEEYLKGPNLLTEEELSEICNLAF